MTGGFRSIGSIAAELVRAKVFEGSCQAILHRQHLGVGELLATRAPFYSNPRPDRGRRVIAGDAGETGATASPPAIDRKV